MSQKVIQASGKRKTATARATLRPGKGVIRVNSVLLSEYGNSLSRMRIQEPLMLSELSGFDIDVDVVGGGHSTQSDAVRLAIGRAIAKHDQKLEKVLLSYDRTLLVADVRRKETRKPNRHGKARAKRQKSYR